MDTISVHLRFDLTNEQHKAAYDYIVSHTSERKKSDFIIALVTRQIEAESLGAEIAKTVVAEISRGGTKKISPASPAKSGRKRGRPPKQKTVPQAADSVISTGVGSTTVSPAYPVAASTPTQAVTGDADDIIPDADFLAQLASFGQS